MLSNIHFVPRKVLNFIEVYIRQLFSFQVKNQIHDAGFLCDHDLDTGTTMNKKIRNAQLAQYNFIFGKDSSLLQIVPLFFSE